MYIKLERKNMKKIILAVTLLAVAGSQVPSAKANGWPIAAGVLGGLAVGTAIGAATAPRVYYAPQQVYYPSTTSYAYQPAPAAPAYQYQSAPAIGNAPTVADAPAVTYYQAAPAPVVYQSAPVVYSAPAYYAPLPVFGFGFGFGRPYWGYGGYHGYYGGYHGGYGGYHGGYHHH
jgi:hypothetical protein